MLADMTSSSPVFSPGIVLAAALAAIPPAGAGGVRQLDLEQWARPRSGAAVAQMPALRATVHEWMAAPAGRVVIRYPGGEEGGLWAQELKSWLISLGVPGAHIELWAGSRSEDSVELEVQQ